MPGAMFITDVLKLLKTKYQALIVDAETFFEEFEDVYLVYDKELARTREVNKQLDMIIAFKKEHGYYPTIKDQDDTKQYVSELQNIRFHAQEILDSVEPKVLGGFRRRMSMVNEIADIIIEQTTRDKDANKFLTTLVLRAPLPNDQARCPSNEKNKPLFMAALSVSLLKQLVKYHLIEDKYIISKVPAIRPDDVDDEILNNHKDAFEEYNKDVLRPLIIAIILHEIGSYSHEADLIFKGKRFGTLSNSERRDLINITMSLTKRYLKYGLGQPDKESFDVQQAADYKSAVQRYNFMETILDNYLKSEHPVGNLLRIPMIYASFLLSTKTSHTYASIYKAYDIVKSGVTKGLIYGPFAQAFLKMVGRFPLGCGIYFISKDTNQPEKAVVIGLNPKEPNTAIVKQLTRRQVKFEDHTQTSVSYKYNLLNEEARENSDFNDAYYESQFSKGFIWNPAESWELEIDHSTFWRRDNSTRSN